MLCTLQVVFAPSTVLIGGGANILVLNTTSEVRFVDIEDHVEEWQDCNHRCKKELYRGAVTAPSGLVIFAPHRAQNVGVFDPYSLTFKPVSAYNAAAWPNMSHHGKSSLFDGETVARACTATSVL